MLSYFSSLALAVSLVGAMPADQSVESDYGKALEATKQSARPLLVVLETPDQKLLSDAELTKEDSVLAKYDICRVDASTEYGKKVAAAFGASAFPYEAIIDREGKEVLYRHAGSQSIEQINDTLERFQLGVQPKEVRVMKPVQTQPSYQPAYSQPAYQAYNPTSNCPSCQRGW